MLIGRLGIPGNLVHDAACVKDKPAKTRANTMVAAGFIEGCEGCEVGVVGIHRHYFQVLRVESASEIIFELTISTILVLKCKCFFLNVFIT